MLSLKSYDVGAVKKVGTQIIKDNLSEVDCLMIQQMTEARTGEKKRRQSSRREEEERRGNRGKSKVEQQEFTKDKKRPNQAESTGAQTIPRASRQRKKRRRNRSGKHHPATWRLAVLKALHLATAEVPVKLPPPVLPRSTHVVRVEALRRTLAGALLELQEVAEIHVPEKLLKDQRWSGLHRKVVFEGGGKHTSTITLWLLRWVFVGDIRGSELMVLDN